MAGSVLPTAPGLRLHPLLSQRERRGRPPPEARTELACWAGLLVVLVGAAWLRQRYFMGVVGPDNFDYLQIADSVRRGTAIYARDVFPFHVGRLTMVLPLAASLSWFGVSEWSAAAWAFVCSLGGVLLAFLFGRRLAGPVAGLVAAAVLALSPLDVLYATTPLPDTAFALFAGLAAYLFLVGLDRQGVPGALAMLGSGLAIGVAYYARVNGPFVLAAFALWLLVLRRRPPRRLVWIGVGFAAVLALGAAFVVARGGSPLFELEQLPKLSAMNAGMVVSRGGRDPLLHFGGTLLFHPIFRGWSWLCLAAAAGLLLVRDRRLLFPAILCVVWYVYLEVFSQYPAVAMVQKEPRYLTPLLLPMALAVGIAGARIATWARGAPRIALALVGVAAASTLVGTPLRAAGAIAAEQRTLESGAPRAAGAALRELPRLPVYVTSDWLKYLNFFGGFVYDLDFADPATLPAARLRQAKLDAQSRPVGVGRGLVVHDETYGLAVPPTWTLLRRVEPKIAIYYAPDPTLPDSGLYEPRLGLAARVDDRLAVVAVATTREQGSGPLSVAVDWLSTGAAPSGRLMLALRDASGRDLSRAEATLDAERALPSALWTAGGVYRVYYDLPAPGVALDALRLFASVDGGAAVDLGPIVPPRVERLAEPELFGGVMPDQDRALGALSGWGSYSQPPYSGGKAAIAKTVGAVASGTLARALAPGDQRLYLRVFSYGAGENAVEVSLNGQAALARWRSGAPGIGWVAVDFAGNAGGAEVDLTVKQVGQSFAIVDLIAG